MSIPYILKPYDLDEAKLAMAEMMAEHLWSIEEALLSAKVKAKMEVGPDAVVSDLDDLANRVGELQLSVTNFVQRTKAHCYASTIVAFPLEIGKEIETDA